MAEAKDSSVDPPVNSKVNMKAPLPLILTKKNGKMKLNNDVLDILCDATRPISVIAIVGKYRTGKSYIMNRFFGRNSGFSLGQTIEASTKGIWLWAQPHPMDPSRTLVLLDTEGLHDVEKGDETHDMKLFTLAILLSNCLIYNVMGALDDALIKELHLVTALIQHIKTKEDQEETGVHFGTFFPNFFILLRDFFLDLKLGSQDCTANEYLERSLKIKAGRGVKVNEYNEPRHCIREFFPRRKCFTICRPVKDEEKLRNLDLIQDEDIRPEFLSQTQEATDAILGEAKEMSVDGNPINGKRFMELVNFYVKCINDGAVPCIGNASNLLKKTACQEALEGALHVFDRVMNEHTGGKLPIEYDDMANIQKIAHDAAMEYYQRNSLFDSGEQYKTKLMNQLEKKYQEVKEKNNRESLQKCKDIIGAVFLSLNEHIESKTFLVAGGHEYYQKEKDLLVANYKNEPNKGPMADQVLHEHLETLTRVEESIIHADKNISKDDKKKALNLGELRQSVGSVTVESFEQELERKDLERQRTEHIELIKQILVEMQREKETIRVEHKQALREKEKEYMQLVKEGVARQEEVYKQQIDELKQVKEEKEKKLDEQTKEIRTHQEQSERLTKQIAEKESKIAELEDQIKDSENKATKPGKCYDGKNADLSNTQTRSWNRPDHMSSGFIGHHYFNLN